MTEALYEGLSLATDQFVSDLIAVAAQTFRDWTGSMPQAARRLPGCLGAIMTTLEPVRPRSVSVLFVGLADRGRIPVDGRDVAQGRPAALR